jgi:hypothetical protein
MAEYGTRSSAAGRDCDHGVLELHVQSLSYNKKVSTDLKPILIKLIVMNCFTLLASLNLGSR